MLHPDSSKPLDLGVSELPAYLEKTQDDINNVHGAITKIINSMADIIKGHGLKLDAHSFAYVVDMLAEEFAESAIKDELKKMEAEGYETSSYPENTAKLCDHAAGITNG